MAIRGRDGLLKASQKRTWLGTSDGCGVPGLPSQSHLKEKVEILAKHPQIPPAFGWTELGVLPEVWKKTLSGMKKLLSVLSSLDWIILMGPFQLRIFCGSLEMDKT